jgi:thioredoxin-like negative regulator of GroEL
MTREDFWDKVNATVKDGDYARALSLAQERLHTLPGDVDATIALCRSWIKLGRLDAAMEILGEVEDKIARLAGIFAAVGDLCLEAGLREESRYYYRRFLAVKPSSPETEAVKRKLAALEEQTSVKGEAEETEEDEAAPPFYTLTMADLYISQEHWDHAQKVLDFLAVRDDLQEAVASRLTLMREKRQAKIQQTMVAKRRERLLGDLETWHRNALRMMGHAV